VWKSGSLKIQEAQLSYREGRPYRLYPKSGVRLPVEKRAISQIDCSPVHAMVTLLYQMLQSTLGYDTVIRRTWMTAADSNFAFKMATKLLQIRDTITNSQPIGIRRRPIQRDHRGPLQRTALSQYMRYRRQTDDTSSCPRLDLTVGQKRPIVRC